MKNSSINSRHKTVQRSGQTTTYYQTYTSYTEVHAGRKVNTNLQNNTTIASDGRIVRTILSDSEASSGIDSWSSADGVYDFSSNCLSLQKNIQVEVSNDLDVHYRYRKMYTAARVTPFQKNCSNTSEQSDVTAANSSGYGDQPDEFDERMDRAENSQLFYNETVESNDLMSSTEDHERSRCPPSNRSSSFVRSPSRSRYRNRYPSQDRRSRSTSRRSRRSRSLSRKSRRSRSLSRKSRRSRSLSRKSRRSRSLSRKSRRSRSLSRKSRRSRSFSRKSRRSRSLSRRSVTRSRSRSYRSKSRSYRSKSRSHRSKSRSHRSRSRSFRRRAPTPFRKRSRSFDGESQQREMGSSNNYVRGSNYHTKDTRGRERGVYHGRYQATTTHSAARHYQPGFHQRPYWRGGYRYPRGYGRGGSYQGPKRPHTPLSDEEPYQSPKIPRTPDVEVIECANDERDSEEHALGETALEEHANGERDAEEYDNGETAPEECDNGEANAEEFDDDETNSKECISVIELTEDDSQCSVEIISCSLSSSVPEPAPAPQQAKKPEPAPQQAKKPEPAPQQTKKPEPAPQQAKKPEPAPQQAKKPEPAPQQAKKPEPAPQQTKKPEPAPQQAKKPEPAPQQAKKPEPAPQQAKKPEPVPQQAKKPEPVPQQAKKRETAPQTKKREPAPQQAKKPEPAPQTKKRETAPQTKKPEPGTQQAKEPKPATQQTKKPEPAPQQAKKPEPAPQQAKKPEPAPQTKKRETAPQAKEPEPAEPATGPVACLEPEPAKYPVFHDAGIKYPKISIDCLPLSPGPDGLPVHITPTGEIIPYDLTGRRIPIGPTGLFLPLDKKGRLYPHIRIKGVPWPIYQTPDGVLRLPNKKPVPFSFAEQLPVNIDGNYILLGSDSKPLTECPNIPTEPPNINSFDPDPYAESNEDEQPRENENANEEEVTSRPGRSFPNLPKLVLESVFEDLIYAYGENLLNTIRGMRTINENYEIVKLGEDVVITKMRTFLKVLYRTNIPVPKGGRFIFFRQLWSLSQVKPEPLPQLQAEEEVQNEGQVEAQPVMNMEGDEAGEGEWEERARGGWQNIIEKHCEEFEEELEAIIARKFQEIIGRGWGELRGGAEGGGGQGGSVRAERGGEPEVETQRAEEPETGTQGAEQPETETQTQGAGQRESQWDEISEPETHWEEETKTESYLGSDSELGSESEQESEPERDRVSDLRARVELPFIKAVPQQRPVLLRTDTPDTIIDYTFRSTANYNIFQKTTPFEERVFFVDRGGKIEDIPETTETSVQCDLTSKKIYDSSVLSSQMARQAAALKTAYSTLFVLYERALSELNNE